MNKNLISRARFFSGWKKMLVRSSIALATLGIIIGGAAAFSAFEAHIVNVTATIQNATDISTSAISFGNVFPQEILHSPVTLSLSSSFLSDSNTGASSVDYVIKQKPKCMATDPQNPVQYAQVTDVPPISADAPITFTCPVGYAAMPLLCPYLSKTSGTLGDVSVPSFHGPTTLADWNDSVSVQTEAVGHLSKTSATSTKWDIDLHAPCFKGQCAQDWDTFVTNANPNVTPNPEFYQADPTLSGKAMGCDLWYEVNGISGAKTVTVRAADLDTTSSNPATVATDGLNKWFMYNDSNDTIDNTLGSFVAGPGTPPHGTGSVQFTLGANPLDRKNIATFQFSGTSLASITQMSFAAYSHSGVAGPTESPYLNFNVDFPGNNPAFQGRLVYVPSANGAVPQDSWNTYDTINSGNGLWTWSRFASNGNKWPDNNTNQYRTWSSLMAAFPSARLLPAGGWLGVRVGEPGPTNYIGNVDNFSIGISGNTRVYDFEN